MKIYRHLYTVGGEGLEGGESFVLLPAIQMYKKFPGSDRGAISLLASTFTFTFKLGNCVLYRGVDRFSQTKYLVQVKS